MCACALTTSKTKIREFPLHVAISSRNVDYKSIRCQSESGKTTTLIAVNGLRILFNTVNGFYPKKPCSLSLYDVLNEVVYYQTLCLQINIFWNNKRRTGTKFNYARFGKSKRNSGRVHILPKPFIATDDVKESKLLISNFSVLNTAFESKISM